MDTNGFVRKHRISMSVEWTDQNPNMDSMPAGSRHFRCVLKRKGRQMTVYYSQGPAHEKEPTAADVLDCVASDASGEYQSFEDWARDYGYDTDSRKAERTFNIVQRQTQQLGRFLHDADLFEELIYKTERTR